MEIPKYPRFSFAYYKFKNENHPIYADCKIYLSSYHDAFHIHDFPQLWFCRRGACTYYIDQKSYSCSEGTFVVLPAGSLHTFRIPEGQETELMVVHISPSLLLDTPAGQYPNTLANLFLPGFAKEAGWEFSPCRQLSDKSIECISECLSRIALVNYGPMETNQTELLCQTMETIFSLPEFCLPSTSVAKSQSLLQTRVLPIYQSAFYVNQHFFEKISEDAILQAGGISRSGFYRYFKRVMGCSYSQYLQQVRVDHVYIYLKYTNYPLSYISDACGFSDMQYMSQVFSRYWGVSPNRRRVYLRWLYSGTEKE